MDGKGGVGMLKDIKLPKLLREFIESAEQLLLNELEAECVEHAVELTWVDMIYPSYATVTFYVIGSKQFGRNQRCLEIEQKLNDIKPDGLCDCMPVPNIIVKCC